MHALRWVRYAFFAAAGLQVLGLFLDRNLMPYAGTGAMAALLAAALLSANPPGVPRWTRSAALSGLSLLTLTAFLADLYGDGYGWPTAYGQGEGLGAMLEPVLLAASAAALGAAVLGRAGRALRWRHLPAGIVALTFVLWVVGAAQYGGASTDSRIRVMVLVPAALAIACAGMAANAGLWSRGRLRTAGAGLGVVVALALGGLLTLEQNELLRPPADPAAETLRTDTYQHLVIDDVGPLYYRTYSDDYGMFDYGDTDPAAAVVVEIPVVTEVPIDLTNPWETETDWSRAAPALQSGLVFAGLVLLVVSLFRLERYEQLPPA
ncbi:hypothetical protein [Actinoplanes sp. NPDC051859]|uniref:hypothetical protein n=1 Tax=Actinoplanes sp. NPDC051859 TaxID=3363909 RepID=UPI0037AFFB11